MPNHWCVLHYRDSDVETFVEQVCHSRPTAEVVINDLADQIAKQTGRKVTYADSGYDVPMWFVHDENIEDPTDDEHHHQLWIQSV